MLPAAVLLLLFLTYPLGLGTWLGFTDAKIGRAGEWIGSRTTRSCGATASRGWRCSTPCSTRRRQRAEVRLGLWLACC
jgi:multiple sugar transport system permease protein